MPLDDMTYGWVSVFALRFRYPGKERGVSGGFALNL